MARSPLVPMDAIYAERQTWCKHYGTDRVTFAVVDARYGEHEPSSGVRTVCAFCQGVVEIETTPTGPDYPEAIR